MARKKKAAEHVNHERWLVSYADFITLLFATFTALYAISNADMEKFKMMAKSLDKAFNGKDSVVPTISLDPNNKGSGDMVIQIVESPFTRTVKDQGEGGPKRGDGDDAFNAIENLVTKPPRNKPDARTSAPAGSTPDSPSSSTQSLPTLPTPNPATPAPTPVSEPAELGTPEGKANDALAQQIQHLLDQIGLKEKIEVRQEKRGTVISLGEAAFFAPGGIDVLPQSVHTLDRILNALRDKEFEIRIEGHTDNIPVSAARAYRTNEELSALRASRIMEFMMSEYGFEGRRLSVAGYGPWRPISANDTTEGRQKNRRVDLVILNKSEIAKDPH